jgi:hypothetical protein
MGWEDPQFIEDFNTSAPGGPLPTDDKSQGDDHIRSVKDAIQASFPGTSGPWKTTSTIEAAPATTEQHLATRGQIESGAVRNGAYGSINGTSFTGQGIASVSHVTIGVYAITFDDAATSTTNQVLTVQLVDIALPGSFVAFVAPTANNVVQVSIYNNGSGSAVPIDYPFTFIRKVY